LHHSISGELEAVMKSMLEKLAISALECIKQIDIFNHNGQLCFSETFSLFLLTCFDLIG
jgi:hypothetical protein